MQWKTNGQGKKCIIKIFKEIGFKIEIKTNLKQVDVLDVNFDLASATHTDHSRKKVTSYCTSPHRQITHQASSNKSQHPSLEDYMTTQPMKTFLTPQNIKQTYKTVDILYPYPSCHANQRNAKGKGTSFGSTHPTTKASKPTSAESSLI